jgi:hypothetical protein
VSNPTEHHPVFWEYVNQSVLPDAVADLVGPEVRFHHSKLNFKWSPVGEEVKWHYDISFWPHTNYSPLTIGTYLYDCGMDQGPLGVIPESHLLGGLPHRPGGVADAAQLPDDPRLAAQRLRPGSAAATRRSSRCSRRKTLASQKGPRP